MSTSTGVYETVLDLVDEETTSVEVTVSVADPSSGTVTIDVGDGPNPDAIFYHQSHVADLAGGEAVLTIGPAKRYLGVRTDVATAAVEVGVSAVANPALA